MLAVNLARVNDRIHQAARRSGRTPDGIQLIAVTKSVSVETARELHQLGVPNLAESRPQKLWEKHDSIPEARWHLIGHLQRNKLERTVPLCSLIHSVDSLRLLTALDAFGRKHQPVPILLQFNCSHEEVKGGFQPEQVHELADILPGLIGLRIEGLMTMAALHADPDLCRPAFAELRSVRDKLQQRTGLSLPSLSMGMSNDFEVAIEEGATMVRLGSILFEGVS